MAQIQFVNGVEENDIPDVRLTRSPDLRSGTATFFFEKPSILSNENAQDITGMYMIDEEGELVAKDVSAKFVNGQPSSIKAVYVMKSPEEWDRFMRFMERYAREKGLGFNQS